MLLPSGWNAVSSFKACLKPYQWLIITISTIPLLQRRTCLRPSNIQLFLFCFFFSFSFSFNLDDHWKYIQQNQQHIKKQRHALPAQECVCTTAPPNPAHDYNCWYLQLQELLTAWRCIWGFWEKCPHAIGNFMQVFNFLGNSQAPKQLKIVTPSGV